ncbi:MAG: hypothetical protein PHG06_22835, partial [Parabacteroides sp.]|nr:hypothetical protein [Parabacteroides sp.]
MKLSAEIIYDELNREYNVELAGNIKRELMLGLPELYFSDETPFKENHVYIARSDKLPKIPPIDIPSLIICFGGKPSNWYYKSDFSLIVVYTDTDMPTLFNSVQEIYSKYIEWNDALNEIIDTTADLQTIVDISTPIFKNFIAIIDDDMNYLAYSRDFDLHEFEELLPDNNDKAPFKVINNLIRTLNDERKHFEYKSITDDIFVKSLFRGTKLVGIIMIYPSLHALTPGELVLATHLSEKSSAAFSRLSK